MKFIDIIKGEKSQKELDAASELRAKEIYKYFKKGTIVDNGHKYRYDLPDDYVFFPASELGENKPQLYVPVSHIKYTEIFEDGTEELKDNANISIVKLIDWHKKIKVKFKKFGIYFG